MRLEETENKVCQRGTGQDPGPGFLSALPSSAVASAGGSSWKVSPAPGSDVTPSLRPVCSPAALHRSRSGGGGCTEELVGSGITGAKSHQSEKDESRNQLGLLISHTTVSRFISSILVSLTRVMIFHSESRLCHSYPLSFSPGVRKFILSPDSPKTGV